MKETAFDSAIDGLRPAGELQVKQLSNPVQEGVSAAAGTASMMRKTGGSRFTRAFKRMFGKASDAADAVSDAAPGIDTAATAAREGSTIAGAGADATAGLEAAGTVAKGAGAWGTAQQVAGKVAVPLAIAAGTLETGIAIKHKDGHAAASAAGGTAGGIAGMILADVAADAAIGTVVGAGPWGTAAGVAFGIVTGIGCAIAGSKATDKVAGGWLDRKLKERGAKGAASPASIETADGAGHAAKILQERQLQAQAQTSVA